MHDDDRFTTVPELPQYGELHACCPATLPSTGDQVAVALPWCLAWLACWGIGVVIISKTGNMHLTLFAVPAVGLALGILVRLLFRFLGHRIGKQTLFVFDGGIHVNEKVSWLKARGNQLRHSSLRQVSYPWRVLRNLRVQQFSHQGEPAVKAQLRLPDGRQLRLCTTQNSESVVAISKLVDKLGC